MGTVIIFEPRTLAPLSSATRSSPDWVMQIGPDKSACRKFGAFWRPRTIRFPRRSTLHPSVANARHGLTLAGVFHGVKTCPLAHSYKTQNLAGLAIQFDYPAGRSGRLIERLHSRPQRPIDARLERIGSSQVWNLAQKLSVEVEFLYPPVFTVSNIEDIVLIHHDGVWQTELPRTVTRAAPLAHLPSISGVLKDARIGVSIANEDHPVRRECNIGCSAEGAKRWFRQTADVHLKH
jgi:hypothetical protein